MTGITQAEFEDLISILQSQRCVTEVEDLFQHGFTFVVDADIQQFADAMDSDTTPTKATSTPEHQQATNDDHRAALWETCKNLPSGQQVVVITFLIGVLCAGWCFGLLTTQYRVEKAEAETARKQNEIDRLESQTLPTETGYISGVEKWVPPDQ